MINKKACKEDQQKAEWKYKFNKFACSWDKGSIVNDNVWKYINAAGGQIRYTGEKHWSVWLTFNSPQPITALKILCIFSLFFFILSKCGREN